MKIVQFCSQDRQSCYQNIQQTSHPYIPNVPNNPYPQQQAYPHHLGGNHVQHNLHGQDGRSPRQVHQPELCGFQGDLNEKNQVRSIFFKNAYITLSQSQMEGQSHVGNIYVSQPSPDSERFRDMKIQSPTSNSQQPEADGKDSAAVCDDRYYSSLPTFQRMLSSSPGRLIPSL